ncbi:Smr/MutS family protein [Spirosoma sordidisoli]|uniref:DNA mismatch repair protein MutS n=1 Tax=Spirosoma sordidisoli TaxID=2502893 RepID=A0A4Q2URU4_9BACT|nr:Smr/MutS family protein [Spirosoma sordidisoli]RYC70445.1 DNA mismatch repair protein MutS [Spirosoma sordidisoli]
MNIGDKVRLLRAKEQGVVSRFLPGDMIEIEIEDGFRIPVMRSEIVPVSPLEAERLLKTNTYAPQKPAASASSLAILSNQGIYLAFLPVNDREYTLHLINNTDWEFAYALGEESAAPAGGVQFRGVHSGLLKPKSQQKMNDLYTHATFENWPTFVVQGLWFRAGKSSLRPPLVKRFKARASTFFKNKVTVPVLSQPGFQTQLDAEAESTAPAPAGTRPQPAGAVPQRPSARPTTIRPDELKAEMLKAKTDLGALSVEKPSSVVDLHVEALLPNGPGNRTPSDLLTVQLHHFEKNLENAIASGMNDITFIHGVGSGALKTEIHRRLGQHPNVRFFEDAQKQKFGYGATKVTIK